MSFNQNCLSKPLNWEKVQEQESIACRLRESYSKRNDETLTAHFWNDESRKFLKAIGS